MQRARKVEHKQARAKDILDAALALYRARGFAAFTMADLAAEVGLAKGTVFLYFPTKEALGLALTGPVVGVVGTDRWLVVVAAVMGVSSIAALAAPSVRRLTRQPAPVLARP